MTRKGKLPITLPKGVEVKIDGQMISVKGPKGLLKQEIMDGIIVNVRDSVITVDADEKTHERSNFHGLFHALISNMVTGTTTGFEKKLEMIGVGYRANVQGNNLNLQVGFSHPTLLPIPAGLEVKVEKNTTIVITGADKQSLGQFASTIRAIRPPEPYQGKGIRYQGEYVRKKESKR